MQEGRRAVARAVAIARENGETMRLAAVMGMINGLPAEETITYAPSYGIPALRKLWQAELFRKNPSLDGKTISLPVVSSGITHAITVFAELWVSPGDVVIVPEPMWGNYAMIFTVRKHAEIVQFPIFDANGRFNLEAFELLVRKECSKREKIIVVLNFPHNPSGYTISTTEARQIVRVLTDAAAAGTDVIAVTDDSYFGLFYEEDTLKESLFALLSDRHPRLLAVKVDGCTKEYFVWGLRIGFITYGARVAGAAAPVYEALEKKTAGCVRGTISNACHLSQSIVLKSMQLPSFAAEIEEKFNILQKRALKVKDVLSDPKFSDAWDVLPFNSGYFMCLKMKKVDAEQLRLHLLHNYGVGLIAIGQQHLRVAFSCVEEEEIPELFEIIHRGARELLG